MELAVPSTIQPRLPSPDFVTSQPRSITVHHKYAMAYHCVHGTAPTYLADCSRHQRSSPVAVYALPTQRRCWCRRLSGSPSACCGASVEQSATTHQGRLITVVISAADESSFLPHVVQLTQFCTIFVPAVHYVMLFYVFILCKVPLQLL